MKRDLEIYVAPTLYERIQTIRMSEADRLTAVNAMRNAELIVDAFGWLKNKAVQLGERVSLRPNVQH